LWPWPAARGCPIAKPGREDNVSINILNIWRKELMDTIRDRKALIQAILVPLAIGIMYAVINPLLISLLEARAEEPITVPAQGIEYAGQEFIAVLERFDITLEPFEGDMETAIVAGEEAAGLVIPAGFGDHVANEQSATLTLLTNDTAGGLFGGSFSVRRLDLALNAYSQAVAVNRLQARDIDPSLLTPIALDAQDLATPEQRAGVFASLMLPILVGVVAAQGGMFIAIDVTAGEKERGTLEALLVTPTSDVEIFIGKLAAVFTMTTAPIALTLLGFWFSSNVLPETMTEGAVLPLVLVVQTILITLPLALFLNVVLMIISIRTKAFKDAQSSATPVIMGVMFATIAAAFVPPSNPLLFLIPIYGTSAVVGVLAVGGVVPANAILLSVVGSLAAAAVGAVLALQLFNRERLLYSV